MSVTADLKIKYSSLWSDMTNHAFVNEMGMGTLDPEKFRRYFLQDYVFVNDLVVLTANAISKAPDIKSASIFNDFLTGITNPENDLFVSAFEEFGADYHEYSSVSASPTTRAFGDFLVRTALEGNFDDIALVLYVTEGTYLEWGTRLLNERAEPTSATYREWIRLHGPDVLGDLVSWLQNYVDKESKLSAPRADYLFKMTLRYEYLFWESAYNGEAWFDQ